MIQHQAAVRALFGTAVAHCMFCVGGFQTRATAEQQSLPDFPSGGPRLVDAATTSMCEANANPRGEGSHCKLVHG